jgi:predicted AlkP superfamily pyrophosphatase or phosphodiesterase
VPRVTVIALAISIASGLLFSLGSVSGADGPPKLAVLIVVDQMRADFVDRFQADWTGGLKRMVTQGAWFRRAAYPYLETVTCAGHATISTGALPHRHGIFQNLWWDRDSARQITCTEDPRASDIGYGVPVRTGNSGHRLLAPTFADVLRTQRHGRIVTLSLKDRSAIMLAGHGGDAVTWLSDTVDGWMTSSVFSTAPVPVVQKFLAANRMSADYGKTWTRALNESRYSGRDDAIGEQPPPGWTRTFPHRLTGTSKTPDSSFLAQWERSPFVDAFLGRFAAAMAEGFQLGRHDTTDLLAVSFSGPDIVGHSFGPRSQEVQDMYVNLDRTIGALLDRLDATVGRGRWVAALTSDHGVTAIPEQVAAEGKDAGRVNSSTIVTTVEQNLRSPLGPGGHVAAIVNGEIYFDPGVYAKLQKSPKLFTSRRYLGCSACFAAKRCEAARRRTIPSFARRRSVIFRDAAAISSSFRNQTGLSARSGRRTAARRPTISRCRSSSSDTGSNLDATTRPSRRPTSRRRLRRFAE